MSLVRPSRFAGGGGASPAFGLSGAPDVPRPESRRGKMLAIQVGDDERGRFTERVFEFPDFEGLAPQGLGVATGTIQTTVPIVSNRTSFVRLVAFRGILSLSDVLPLTGLEEANLLLKLSINGEEDAITNGKVATASSFGELFSPIAPWFWYAAPPRLRSGDELTATLQNTFPPVEGSPTMNARLALRIVDDEWWRAMYAHDNGRTGMAEDKK
jgi:hypothetical protein